MTTITNLTVRDIRFPTSDELHGSDAIHVDPDYSCAYVTLTTDVDGLRGTGSPSRSAAAPNCASR